MIGARGQVSTRTLSMRLRSIWSTTNRAPCTATASPSTGTRPARAMMRPPAVV